MADSKAEKLYAKSEKAGRGRNLERALRLEKKADALRVAQRKAQKR